MKKLIYIAYIVAMIGLLVIVNRVSKNKMSNAEHMDIPSQQTEPKKTPEELQAEQWQKEQQQVRERELAREQAIQQQKTQLANEIALLNEPFDISGYTNSVSSMEVLIEKMNARASLILESENSGITEIEELAKQLKLRAVTYQVKAFPILRKSYATRLNNQLWEVDGKAYVSGNSNIYITVVSPELTLNQMKRKAHEALYPSLQKLRFRQARYKWYDGSEYTYWNVFEGKDADL